MTTQSILTTINSTNYAALVPTLSLFYSINQNLNLKMELDFKIGTVFVGPVNRSQKATTECLKI